MIRALRFLLLALLVGVYLVFGWVAGLVILGLFAGTWAARIVVLRRTVHGELHCEQGHAVPTYGLYRCGVCRFTTASWWGRCPHCQSVFGHLTCPTCGRSVANPLTRGWPWA
jgi:hypothetical protein